MLQPVTILQALANCVKPGDVLRLLDEFRQRQQHVISQPPPLRPIPSASYAIFVQLIRERCHCSTH